MKIYETSFKVTTNDFDSNDCLKPVAILNYFQEVAGRHAEDLGIGYEATLKKGLAWILIANRFQVIKPIKTQTTITVKTWPNQPKSLACIRQYQIYDEDGDLAVIGSSKWVIIDIVTKKITVINKDLYHGNYENECNFATDFTQLKTVTEDATYEYKVGESDIDHYKHMNNSRYAEVIFNSLGTVRFNKYNYFEISYRKEALLGDIIYVAILETERILATGKNRNNDINFNAIMEER
jgi:acyl-ACP thioesterase